MQRVRLDAPHANAGVDDASSLLELENHNFFTNVQQRARQAQPREMMITPGSPAEGNHYLSFPLIVTPLNVEPQPANL